MPTTADSGHVEQPQPARFEFFRTEVTSYQVTYTRDELLDILDGTALAEATDITGLSDEDLLTAAVRAANNDDGNNEWKVNEHLVVDSEKSAEAVETGPWQVNLLADDEVVASR